MISRTTEQQIRDEWQRKADRINQGVGLDPETVRLTLQAISHAGSTKFYDRVDYYRQTLPNLSYEIALTLAVHEINKETN
jgi:hypothetical protein